MHWISSGSRFRSQDDHNYQMFNARLLSNGCCHGNRIMADMSGHDVMRPPKFRPNRSIGRRVVAFLIFSNMAAVRYLEFKKKIVIFRHLTFIEVLICCCNTKCHQNWFMHSASRRPYLLNVQFTVDRQRPLPLQAHHSGHVGDAMGCDHPCFVPIGQLLGELWHFQYFSTWRPSAILNFLKKV